MTWPWLAKGETGVAVRAIALRIAVVEQDVDRLRRRAVRDWRCRLRPSVAPFSKTRTNTVARAVPPWPSLTVYVNWSVKVALSGEVYVQSPLPQWTRPPRSSKEVMVSGSSSMSVSLRRTGIVTGPVPCVAPRSSTAYGRWFGSPLTTIVNICEADADPSETEISRSGYEPASPAAGVIVRYPVPSRLSCGTTNAGRRAESEGEGVVILVRGADRHDPCLARLQEHVGDRGEDGRMVRVVIGDAAAPQTVAEGRIDGRGQFDGE